MTNEHKNQDSNTALFDLQAYNISNVYPYERKPLAKISKKFKKTNSLV